MRLFTTMLVALLSILGGCNLKAQVTVSYESESTPVSEITTGYYVIKTKVRATDPYWLSTDNSYVRFASSSTDIELKNVWKIEKNEDGSFYMMNALTRRYVKSQKAVNESNENTGADLTFANEKNGATYFSTRTFTVGSGTTKLDDNAFTISSDVPTATGVRQHLHVYGGSFTNGVPQKLSTWGNTIGTEEVNSNSTLVQFAFYKATVNESIDASLSSAPINQNTKRYYLLNAKYGVYIASNGNTTEKQSDAFTFYIEYQTSGTGQGYYMLRNETQRLNSAPNQIWLIGNSDSSNRNFWNIEARNDGKYYIKYYKPSELGNRTYLNLSLYTPNTVASAPSDDAASWYFIPANESATAARDLKLDIKSGDAVHGNLATFSASYPVSVPENCTAYTATHDATNNVINITELTGNVIPANTGVMIKSETTGEVVMKPTLEAGTAVTGNKLMAVGDADKTFTDDEKNANNIYLLGKLDDTFCFRLMNNEGEQKIGAHKAYIQLDSQVDAASLQINFGGEVTNINNAAVNDTNTKTNVYYDLSGRRVMRPQHGLYIVNGKKVIIK